MKNFGLIGAAGYVAPRHLRAIRDTGNQLLAATDPRDSVGVLDAYFPEAKFFTEIERFDRHLEKLRRQTPRQCVQYLSICSPSYLHDAHVRLALRLRAHAICEKPLVINPWNVDALAELEAETDSRVYTVLQLRVHPALARLKQRLDADGGASRADVRLTYVTPRGPWYHVSWKGQEQKSGGVTMNIGVHFFDALLWLFGPVEDVVTHLSTPSRAAGFLELERARVSWFVSVDAADLPQAARAAGAPAHRELRIDGEEIDLSEGFSELHTRVYQDILEGRGLGLPEARPAIALLSRIRQSEVEPRRGVLHPLLSR
jgi:UDP-N-acetyl-2-amino-2-deoxyglucuronate dehydrogenase